MAAKKPIIALMYDFDKTLCTTDMQAYTFIPDLGMSAEAFWQKASVRTVFLWRCQVVNND